MAIDTASPRTRRALLAATLGAGAATVAAALRPLSAEAASGDPVILGSPDNAGSSFTAIRNSNDPATFAGFASISNYGVLGRTGSQGGHGVHGQNSAAGGTAVYGNIANSTQFNAIGVAGETAGHYSQIGVRGIADPEGIGVHGLTVNGVGVRGEAPGGWGVHGSSANKGVYGETTSGVGVYATATTGYAIRSTGRVRFDKCTGVATIAAGSKSVNVKPGVDLDTTSAVVATLQGSAGGTTTVHRCSVNTTTNTFSIFLTANATAAVKVAWHVFG